MADISQTKNLIIARATLFHELSGSSRENLP